MIWHIDISSSVIYFNLGSHHIPHSGDISNTLMHTSASSIMFTPFNFHDRDASRSRVQGVKLELGDEGTKPRYFGGRHLEGVRLKAVGILFVGEFCGDRI
jgi:primary-amine oxidase